MDVNPSARVETILRTCDDFYRDEVKPREDALAHRFEDRRLSLDDNGQLHPEIWQARKEIMRLSGEAGLYSLHLPKVRHRDSSGVVSTSVKNSSTRW
jgi:acyl-CoA dehydrogenase